MVKRTRSLLKPIYTWFVGKRGDQLGDHDPTVEFGEDSILQQVDPVARCPRTGLVVDEDDAVACRLADGACSELAASGIRVACVRNPCGLVQERRAAA